MKYLKHFENNDLTGITPEQVKEMFYELSDLDWQVNVRESSILKTFGDYTKFDFKMVKYFLVQIFKPNLFASQSILQNLMNSELFKEMVEIANERLEDYGFYIDKSSISIKFTKITFNIYKYENEEI